MATESVFCLTSGFERVFADRKVRAFVGPGLDAITICISMALASLLKSDHLPALGDGRVLLAVGVSMLVLRLGVHWWLGIYRLSWRYFGLHAALKVALVSAGVSALLLLTAMTGVSPAVDSAVTARWLAIEGFITLVGLVGTRAWTRWLFERRDRTRVVPAHLHLQKKVLVVGAGRAGVWVLRELRERPDLGLCPVGVIDDNPHKRGQELEGVTVLGSSHDLAEIGRATEAESIILALPSASRDAFRGVVERCQAAGLPLQTVPALSDLVCGRLHISKIRPLELGDLLGREEVTLDEARSQQISESFGGKRMLVTGAGGSIGSELCRQLCELEPAALIMVENSENNLFSIEQEIRERIGDRAIAQLVDVRDAERVRSVFKAFEPDVIFHAAAYKHVPMMESHPTDAIINNVEGTRCVARAAHEFGAECFVQVSTDKAVNPANVMGASKRMAELVVQELGQRSSTRFSCVRFGNVLGSRGSVLHTFRRQIEAGGPVTVTDPEVTRFFMTIPEAVRLVIQAGVLGAGGDLFLLDMGSPMKIIDLARQMISLAGYDEDEIPLEIVGLRPGEKLYEELLLAEEGAVATSFDRIWKAPSAPVDAAFVRHRVEILLSAAREGRGTVVRRLLAESAIGYTGYVHGTVVDREAAQKVDNVRSLAEFVAERPASERLADAAPERETEAARTGDRKERRELPANPTAVQLAGAR